MAKAQPPTPKPDKEPIVLDAEQLFQGRAVIHIRYKEEIYRLRVTRKGRLVLQK